MSLDDFMDLIVIFNSKQTFEKVKAFFDSFIALGESDPSDSEQYNNPTRIPVY